jgi:general secretion pathway protein B
MSYILEALKRAEQQRGAPARGSASLPRARASDSESRARWPWIVGGGVSVAAVAAVVAFWPAWDVASPVATPEATVAAPEATVVAGPAPAVVSTPPAAEPPRAAPPALPERVVSAPAAPRATEPRPPTPRPGPVVTRPAPPAAAGRSAAPRSEPPPAVDRSTAGRVTPSPVVRPAPRVGERAPTPPPADVARATPLRAVPPEPAPPAVPAGTLKALAATLSIQVLSWAPERKDRFVFLNGRKYGEGQMVDDKIVIEQITEEGVVLSYQGEKLTLKGR